VREVNGGERSVVSMRDIARAAKVFKWFLTYYTKLSSGSEGGAQAKASVQVNMSMKSELRSAIVLTLGYCYHSRLDRSQRLLYRKKLCQTWSKMVADGKDIQWLALTDDKELENMLIETQLTFVSQMDLGEGIALNEALRENLFMLLVSIMNQIPILLIGKPGCSKSLAMNTLQTNLRGNVSSKEFFKSMPAVDVVPYQCSPLSTPDAILKTFQQARNSSIGNKKTIVCVLLDEVGLAEESPHLPLKVLHKELEDLRGIACVGISNWALDAAKMSRCVTLYRPPPTVPDLCVTAEGMVASGNLKGYLKSLSEAFFTTYKTQKRVDFWGMREFYSTVRVINAELKAQTDAGHGASLEPQVLMKTVQRNFGGRPDKELDSCVEIFFERIGMDVNTATRYTPVQLIQQNLNEPDARHLMLLTKNNAALRLLFESGLVDHNKAEVMFGSTFPNDQNDIFVAMNLQRIKTFMQQPISLVLVHCDSLYESLYDLLNQHFMDFGGQRYVRIAHGSKAMKQCPVHRLFRIIVVTEISDAYYRLAPPLLNRFEKQIFLRKDLMVKEDEALLNRLIKFWESVSAAMKNPDAAAEAAEGGPRPIAGYHSELLSSLVFVLRRRHENKLSVEQLLEQAKRMLTLVLTPEAVCMIAGTHTEQERISKFGFDVVTEYFEKQMHSDLPSFAEQLVEDKSAWGDDLGAQVMVLTYSPILGKVGHELQSRHADWAQDEVSLHELSSSTDIYKSVQQFYENIPTTSSSGPKKKFLIIHADPAAASARMIEHCRFLCEKFRNEAKKRDAATSFAHGSMFVVLVVHLARGSDSNFSFDFDSQWHFSFLDSVEPSANLNNMPPLGKMLNTPLLDVVGNLDFSQLLQGCFRASLSRLLYPHSRKKEDLQRQIQLILGYLEDKEFVVMVKSWMLQILRDTPKNASQPLKGTVGSDRNWFSTIATAAHELALAGTFRAALHNRIAVLVGSLLTVLLAHLDRNGGLALLFMEKKRDLWLTLAKASLMSDLSARLHNEAVLATQEEATVHHEVGTDAQTGAKPFESRFPASWFVSKSVNGVRHIIETLPKEEQMASLEKQFKISNLHDIGIQPELDPSLLEDYLSDFTAMHLEWTRRISRETQTRILKLILRGAKGGELVSFLEIHKWFWNQERQVAYCIGLLNAVPKAVHGAEDLIRSCQLSDLNLNLLLYVHKELAGELVADHSSEVRPNQVYRDWLQRKGVVLGLTKDLLSEYDGHEHPMLARLKCDTEPRLETMALFLEHVAVPLNIPLETIKKLAKSLPGEKIRHSKSLAAILGIAQDICHQEGALGSLSTFMEFWILDVCLRDAETISDLEDDLLVLTCDMAAGLPMQVNPVVGVKAAGLSEWSEHVECGIANLGKDMTIPRSESLNLALLRKLVVTSDGRARVRATAKIENLLKEVAKHEGHNDTTFATRYSVLREEAAGQELCKLERIQDWPSMTLEEVFRQINQANPNPAEVLDNIGKIRWLLAHYAQIMCKDLTEPENLTLHAMALIKVNPLLQTQEERLSALCRSVRLYLLKCVERQRGISFLRRLLGEQPLCDAPWVKDWRDAHDIDFEKFIGADLVPKWNPFSGADGTKEYREAKDALVEMMTSTATNSLDKFATKCRNHTEEQQKNDIAGLLMALCQEPGLLAALEVDRKPPWRTKLNDWLASTTDLPVSERERMLLRVFAGDDSVVTAAPDDQQEFLKPFIVSPDRNMDELLRWRVLGHLAAALIAAPKTSVLATLRKIMLEPESLMYGEDRYLPGMDEDIRNRVLKALLERGENIWKFKTHWYKCSCGYTFFIGECGRPMEVTACPQCQTQIGGRDHNATQATEADDDKDRSPQGYMLPGAEKDEKHISFREVASSSGRAVRLLLHASMYCSIGASVKNPMVRIFDHVVNTDSMCDMPQMLESKFILSHFANDWKLMAEILSTNEESLAAGLHTLLHSLHAERVDEPKGAASLPSGLSWEKMDLDWRNKWEETIDSKYLNKMVSSFGSASMEFYQKWGGASEDGTFVAQLQEKADVRDYPREKREKEMPQLWAFRTPVTLDLLHARLGVQQRVQDTFPVLMAVLQRPLFSVLPALGCLVGVFEWHSLLINRFSGRITRREAGQLKVGKVIEDIKNKAERELWERAWTQFQRAWHIAWPHIERHECLEIPGHFRDIKVDRETSMLFCILDQENEGICPLALTQWLTQRHNELAQLLSSTLNRGSRTELDRADEGHRQSPAVSSRLLSQHDVIRYGEDDLMHFLQSRCVTYATGGSLNFDLRQLEQQLRREMSRPEITMELRGFQWLGENFGQSDLKQVIPQKDLPEDVMKRIRSELKLPSLANACLQRVQMASSFIQKSGSSTGENAGNTLFQEYLEQVLQEAPTSIPSQVARAEVRLWHLTAFERLLKQVVNQDPMDGVDPAYKTELPEDIAQQLEAVRKELPNQLTEVLASFAEYQLRSTYIGRDSNMIDTLRAIDDICDDVAAMNAVEEHLPAGILMQHWAATYQLLKGKPAAAAKAAAAKPAAAASSSSAATSSSSSAAASSSTKRW